MHPNSNHEPEQLLRFVRASHSDGDPHQVIVRSFDLRPLSCSCRAGQHNRLRHAVIDVTATELMPIAHQHWLEACGEVDIRNAVRIRSQVRVWAQAAAELAALRSCNYTLTEAGRAASRQDVVV